MKSFYEMWRMLEDYDAWLQKPYQDAYGDPISFSKQFGEGDEDSPFDIEVRVDDGRWQVVGSAWVLDYVPNGSENPASKPVFYKAGEKDERGNVNTTTGTIFHNPGKRLELLPPSIRDEAVKWLNGEVESYINRGPDDDRDYDDRDDYNPDPDGHGYWDNYWNHGPGRDR